VEADAARSSATREATLSHALAAIVDPTRTALRRALGEVTCLRAQLEAAKHTVAAAAVPVGVLAATVHEFNERFRTREDKARGCHGVSAVAFSSQI
jgi:hypothetical protein